MQLLHSMNQEFRGRYARARELLVEFWADELIAISDGNDDVSRDRLRSQR